MSALEDLALIERRQCPECARLAADLKIEAEHRLECQNELFIVRQNLQAHCKEIELCKAENTHLAARLVMAEDQLSKLKGRLLPSEPDVITRYQGKDGSRDWQSASAWLMPGEALAVISV